MFMSLAVLCEFANSLDKREKSALVCKDEGHYALTCAILNIRKTTGEKNGHSCNHRYKSVAFHFDI